jgi:hypothetical protein
MRIVYDKLLQKMEQEGITIADLKYKAGLSYKSIFNIQAGENVSMDDIAKIYDKFHWNPADVLEFKSGKPIDASIKSIYHPEYKIGQCSLDGELIYTYTVIREAERNTGVSHSSISKCLNGDRKSAGGFIWKKIA